MAENTEFPNHGVSGKPTDVVYNSEFVHVIPDHDSDLCQKLYQQWQDGQHCDILLSVKGGEIRSHSCILAAFSPKLKILLDNTAQVLSSIQLTFDINVVQCLVNMMYTGVLSFHTDLLPSVLSTARWLQMDEVVRLCQEFQEAIGLSADEGLLTDEQVLWEVDATNIKTEQNVSSLMLNVADLQSVTSQCDLDSGSDQSCGAQVLQAQEVETSNTNKQSSQKAKQKRSRSGRRRKVPAKVERRTSPRSSQQQKRTRKKIGMVLEWEEDEVVDLDDRKIDKNKNSKECSVKEAAKTSVKTEKVEVPLDGDFNSISEETDKGVERTKPKKCRLSKSVRRKRLCTSIKLNLGESKTSDGAKDSQGKKIPWAQLDNPETSFLEETDQEEIDFTLGKISSIQCRRCRYRFTNIDEYFRHVANHPTLSCDICHIKYYRKSNLTRHMRTCHSDMHYLRCRLCEFVAKTETTLRSHFKAIHPGCKPFLCDHPGCSYSGWKYLFICKHLEIHSDVKQYMCNKCGQSFAQDAGLKSHVRACYQMRAHLCDFCGMAFNQLQSMQNHRRTIHLGEKPYLCKTCGNQFTDHRNLKRHMRIHENSFPYECPICQQKYRHSNSLKAHLKKHGDAAVDIDMALIAKKAQANRQKNTSEVNRGSAADQEKGAGASDNEVRSTTDETGAKQNSEPLTQTDNNPRLDLEEQVLVIDAPSITDNMMVDPNPSAGQLLQQMNKERNSFDAGVPMNSTAPSHVRCVGSSVIPSSLNAQRRNISEMDRLSQTNLLSMSMFSPPNVSLSDPSLLSSTKAANSKFSTEAMGEQRTKEVGQKGLDKSCEQKKQSSYALQTLAEICFKSSK